jgi:hypothetical protein
MQKITSAHLRSSSGYLLLIWDTSIVNLALENISRDLGTGVTSLRQLKHRNGDQTTRSVNGSGFRRTLPGCASHRRRCTYSGNYFHRIDRIAYSDWWPLWRHRESTCANAGEIERSWFLPGDGMFPVRLSKD